MSNEYYVYAYSDPNSCDPFFYVGKGKGNHSHIHLLIYKEHQRLPFYRKLKLMLSRGIQPEITILDSGLTAERAIELEKHFIAKYGKRSDGTGCLLNLTDGGDGGALEMKLSEITRLKMSLARLGQRRPGSGKKGESRHTEESKKKMSEAIKSHPTWQKNAKAARLKAVSKPFCRYCLMSKEIVEVFRNLVDVTRRGYKVHGVRDVLVGRNKSHQYYGWRYLTKEEIERLLKD